jgi:hypothetical protein
VTDECDNVPDNTFCNDGLFCNGEETCDPVNDCQDGTPECTDPGFTCDEVNDECVFSPCDNDGVCESGEDCNNCSDCIGGTAPGFSCGNGLCEAGDGENGVNCPEDCNAKLNGKPANRFSCGFGDGLNPDGCGDPACTTGGFSCTEIPVPDIEYCCGDTVCDGGPECGACGLDCSGDPICEPPPFDCAVFTDKSACNAQATCRWDNRNKECVPN